MNQPGNVWKKNYEAAPGHHRPGHHRRRVIMVRTVGVVGGSCHTVAIATGVACAAAVLYDVFSELLGDPVKYLLGVPRRLGAGPRRPPASPSPWGLPSRAPDRRLRGAIVQGSSSPHRLRTDEAECRARPGPFLVRGGSDGARSGSPRRSFSGPWRSARVKERVSLRLHGCRFRAAQIGRVMLVAPESDGEQYCSAAFEQMLLLNKWKRRKRGRNRNGGGGRGEQRRSSFSRVFRLVHRLPIR